LSERHLLPPRTATTTSDLLSVLDHWRDVPPHVQRVAQEVERIADRGLRSADSPSPIQSAISNQQSAMSSEASFRRAILAGYPDRVAQRREPGSPNVRLASGAGATIAPESGVRDGEFLVALDVQTHGARGSQPSAREPARHVVRRQGPVEQASDARIRIASRVEREWLQPTASEVVHRFDKASGKVRAAIVDRYDALVLAERAAPVDPEIAARLLADAWLERGPREDDDRLLRRLRFAGTEVDAVHLASLVRTAAYGARALDEVQMARALPADVVRHLDRDAPELLAVPSGRHVRLEYHEDCTVSASVKLQEVFGLAETPRIGSRREPVLLALTAPNGRPVQLTRDLRSFWDRTYPAVRKELRGRYPKHPWPEDPWTAPPTARAKKKVRS
jgi:ATP-dependent helicase HrpB